MFYICSCVCVCMCAYIHSSMRASSLAGRIIISQTAFYIRSLNHQFKFIRNRNIRNERKREGERECVCVCACACPQQQHLWIATETEEEDKMKRNSFDTHTNTIRAFKINSKKCTIAFATNDRQFHKPWDNCSILPWSSSSSSYFSSSLSLLPLYCVIAANTFFIFFPTIELCAQLTGQLFAGTHIYTPDSDHRMLLLNFYLFHKISTHTHTHTLRSSVRSFAHTIKINYFIIIIFITSLLFWSLEKLDVRQFITVCIATES